MTPSIDEEIRILHNFFKKCDIVVLGLGRVMVDSNPNSDLKDHVKKFVEDDRNANPHDHARLTLYLSKLKLSKDVPLFSDEELGFILRKKNKSMPEYSKFLSIIDNVMKRIDEFEKER